MSVVVFIYNNEKSECDELKFFFMPEFELFLQLADLTVHNF